MLARHNRLQLRQEKAFFNHAQHFFTPHFTFFYQNCPDLPYPQIAIIIPKKALRLSTARHALKRKIALLIRPDLHHLPPLKLALVVTPKIALASPSEMQANWSKFIRQMQNHSLH